MAVIPLRDGAIVKLRCGTCAYWAPCEGSAWRESEDGERIGTCSKYVQVPKIYRRARYTLESDGADCPFWEPILSVSDD